MASSGLSVSGTVPKARQLRTSRRQPRSKLREDRKTSNQGSARSSKGRVIGDTHFKPLVSLGLGRRSPLKQSGPPKGTEERRKGPYTYEMETRHVETAMTTRRFAGLERKNVPFQQTQIPPKRKPSIRRKQRKA